MLKVESQEGKGVDVEIQAKNAKQISNELLGLLMSLEQEGYDIAAKIAILGYKLYLKNKEHKDANN